MKNKNYLDYIPKINQKWKETDKENIELIIENKGLCNRLTQKLLCKPQISYISLDKYGSFVWKNINGKNTVYDIGQQLQKKYKDAGVELYERLTKFIGILEMNRYIIITNKRFKNRK